MTITKEEKAAIIKEFGKYEKKQVLEIRTPFKNKGQVHIEIEIMTGDFE